MGKTTPLVESSNCRAVSEVLGRVGDRWTVLIVVALQKEPQRFAELRRSVGNVSQQMLTIALRALERDGMISRTVKPTAPPQVSYELTDLGRSLAGALQTLAAWSIDNLDAIHESRRSYDERRTSAQA